MPTYYVSPSGGGNGGTYSTPLTMAQANAAAGPGVEFICKGGTYTTQIFPNLSGSAASPCIYRAADGETPMISMSTRQIDVRARSYITIRGFTVETKAGFSYESSDTSTRIVVDKCTFQNVGPWANTGWGYAQVLIRGSWQSFTNCHFKQYLGPDTIQAWGLNHYFAYNHFEDSGHGSLLMYGEAVIEHNYFRNKWSRAIEFGVSRPDTGTVPKNYKKCLIQHNIFYDVGYDSAANDGYPALGWTADPSRPPIGDAQHTKTGGTGSIYRNNLWVDANEGPAYESTTYHYRSNVSIENYTGATGASWQGHVSIYMQNMRFYHNTFHACKHSTFGVTYNSANAMNANDNRWYNNVISQQARSSWYIDNAGTWFATWHFRNNLFAQTLRYPGNVNYTATQMNANTDGRFPYASGNINGTATFENSDHSVYHADRTKKLPRSNFALASGNGKDAARPIAYATATSTLKTITVDDAWAFSDGRGWIQGDRIIVNGQTRTVTATSPETTPQTLTVDQNTTVNNGNAIYLEMFGTSADMGIASLDTGTETPVVVGTPVVIGTTSASVASTTIASPTLSPAANTDLIISVHCNLAASGAPVVPFSISSTFSPTLSWEKTEQTQGSNGLAVVVFRARTGSNPGSGIVTVTSTNNMGSRLLKAISVDSLNDTAPLVRSVGGGNFSTTALSLDLGAAPTAGNLIMGFFSARNAGMVINHDADFTELYDELSSSCNGQAMYTKTAQQTADWTGTLSSGGNVAILLEWAVAGNVIVDTTPPTTTITSTPANPSPASTAQFAFTGADNVTLTADLTYEVQLDNGGWSVATSPKQYVDLADGSHTFQVRAKDAANNVDATPASYTWTVAVVPPDTTPPNTTITDVPEAYTSSTGATFVFTGTDDTTASGSLAFEVQLDGGGWSASTSPKTYTGLSVGAHTFEVRAKDAANNVDPSPASYTWTIDITAPTTTIVDTPDATTSGTSAVFTFTGTDNASATADLTFEVRLDNGEWQPAEGPAVLYTGLDLGEHTFEVRAIDQALNTDATPATYTWEVIASVLTQPVLRIGGGGGSGVGIGTDIVI